MTKQLQFVSALVLVAVVACIDKPFAPQGKAQRVRVPASNVADYNFTFAGNSYGPNGELIYETNCEGTYDFLPVATDSVEDYWHDEQGNPHHDWVVWYSTEYKQVGCVWSPGYTGPYQGGGTSITYFNDSSNVGIGFVNADGTENGDYYYAPSNGPGFVNFFSAPNGGCSFLYYIVSGGPNNGQYWTNDKTFTAASLDGAHVQAVFQCSY